MASPHRSKEWLAMPTNQTSNTVIENAEYR
jgi:hypothetical protein